MIDYYEFHLHPDGWVYIRTPQGVYVDTPENFSADIGGYSIPKGVREIIYRPGVRHLINSQPQPLNWSEGNLYITAFASLIQAQKARTHTTDEELQKIQAEEDQALARTKAAEDLVDSLRPSAEMRFLLSCTRAQFDSWVAQKPLPDVLWTSVEAIRYLIACKDRQKAWSGK